MMYTHTQTHTHKWMKCVVKQSSTWPCCHSSPSSPWAPMKWVCEGETTPSLWVFAFSFCLFFHFLSVLFPSFIQGFSNIVAVGLGPTHVWQIWLIVSRLGQIIEVNGFRGTFHSARGWRSSWLFLSSAQCVREGLFSRGLLTSLHVKLSHKDETGRRVNGVHAGHLDHNLVCAHVCAAKHRGRFDSAQFADRKWKFYLFRSSRHGEFLWL